MDFERSGTVVWFCVTSRFGWFDTSCARFLGQFYEEIRLLFKPRTSELPAAGDPLPERESGSQPFHRILPSYASHPIDLIVTLNLQDSTTTSRTTNISRRDHQLIVVQLSHDEHTHTSIGCWSKPNCSMRTSFLNTLISLHRTRAHSRSPPLVVWCPALSWHSAFGVQHLFRSCDRPNSRRLPSASVV